MISHKAVGSMTLVILAVASIRVFAAEQTAAELYGQGVHAYFAGDYDSAIDFLSKSIKKNDKDPRAFYFRGLALASRDGLRSGLPDITKGADLEVNRQDDRIYDVNAALQRVQGYLRLELEKQRTAARLAAADKKEKQDRIKYEQLKRREDVVLFDPDRPVKTVNLELPKVDLGRQDPFASGVAFSGGKEVESAAPIPVAPAVAPDQPTTPESDQGEDQPRNPFGLPPAENPFGDTTPAAKPKVEAEANPFGDTNPFGEGMEKVDPNNPIFDDDVKPELPPGMTPGPAGGSSGMNVGGAIMNVLGKTFSGSSTPAPDRNPFADDSPSTTPPTTDPAADDTESESPKKDDPGNPFG